MFSYEHIDTTDLLELAEQFFRFLLREVVFSTQNLRLLAQALPLCGQQLLAVAHGDCVNGDYVVTV